MRTLSLPVAALLLVLAVPGCTTEDGTTPSCVDDVTQDGNTLSEDGCNPFGACRNDNGTVLTSRSDVERECCAGLTGLEVEVCLYGYGVIGAVNDGTIGGGRSAGGPGP